MNPWLIGVMVCLGLLVPVLLFFAGVVVLESVCAQWEENEIRRIAASKEDALPANWRELDGKRSFDEAWAELRRRKGSGA